MLRHGRKALEICRKSCGGCEMGKHVRATFHSCKILYPVEIVLNTL